MTMDDLVIALTGHVPLRGKRAVTLPQGQFTKKDARAFLRRFIGALRQLKEGDALYIPTFGKFKRVRRGRRKIVGFDGETTYMQPETVVLTFRETREQ